MDDPKQFLHDVRFMAEYIPRFCKALENFGKIGTEWPDRETSLNRLLGIMDDMSSRHPKYMSISDYDKMILIGLASNYFIGMMNDMHDEIVARSPIPIPRNGCIPLLAEIFKDITPEMIDAVMAIRAETAEDIKDNDPDPENIKVVGQGFVIRKHRRP